MKNYYEAPESEKLLLSLETSFLGASGGDGGKGKGNPTDPIGNEPTDPGFHAMYNGD